MRTTVIVLLALWCAFALAPAKAADSTAPAAPAAPPAASAAPSEQAEPADAADDSESDDAGEPAAEDHKQAPAHVTESPAEETAEPAAGATGEPGPAGSFPAALPQQTGAAAPTRPTSAAGASPVHPWSYYQLLAVNNIFSRSRGPKPVRPAGQTAVRPPERYLVLKGIVGQPDGYVAFIEDTRTSTTQICKVGDVVGQARITAMSNDGLTYELNGASTHAAIGEYVGAAIAVAPAPVAPAPPVAAGAPAGTATPAATSAAAPAASATPPSASSGAPMTLEERLRQRRLQEEGK
jgi:hypothetical protein